jgi:hypothetical protein
LTLTTESSTTGTFALPVVPVYQVLPRISELALTQPLIEIEEDMVPVADSQ